MMEHCTVSGEQGARDGSHAAGQLAGPSHELTRRAGVALEKGEEDEVAAQGRLIIVLAEPYATDVGGRAVRVDDRTDPLGAVAAAVDALAPGGRVHWVCMACPTHAPPSSSPHVTSVPIPAVTAREWLGEFLQLLLWPCLHSLLQPTGGGGLPPFGEPGALAAAWTATQEATQAFATALASLVQPHDIVLIADPALMLLPFALRAVLADRSVCDRPTLVMALRTPFPSPEVWRCLPPRTALLQGLLGADLVILQSFDDARNLSAAAQHVLGVEARPSWVALEGGRFAALSVLPLGVEPAWFAPSHPSTLRHAADMARALGVEDVQRGGAEETVTAMTTPPSPTLRLITSFDALDMSRGVPQKLLGFEALLTAHPEHVGRVSLVLVLTSEGEQQEWERGGALAWPGGPAPPLCPSSSSWSIGGLGVLPQTPSDFQAESLRRTVHELTGRVNGSFGSPTWLPVRLLRARMSIHERAALYALSAVSFQVSAREGLTVEALEYAAAQESTEDPGVLLYSDFAGGAGALRGALLVNPYDAAGAGEALHSALTIPVEERRERMAQVKAYVEATSASMWAARVLTLAAAAGWSARERRPAQHLCADSVTSSYRACQGGKRLLLFSYNGTLRPYASRVENAAPSPRLRLALARLSCDPANDVWVVSGDVPAHLLFAWLGDLPIGLAADSGFLYRYPPTGGLGARVAQAMLPGLLRAAQPRGRGEGEEGESRTGQFTSTPSSPDTPRTTVAHEGCDRSPPALCTSLTLCGWVPPPPSEWLALYGGEAEEEGGEGSGEAPPEGWPHGQDSSGDAPPLPPRPALDLSWYGPVKETLEFFTARAPGSVLQASPASLLWSYASTQPDATFGESVARDVLVHLDGILFGQPAEVLPAHRKRFLVVRPVGMSKGALLATLLASPRYGRGVTTEEEEEGGEGGLHDDAAPPPPSSPYFSFILLSGDERTDEELWPHALALGAHGWAVVVAPPDEVQPSCTQDSGAPWYVPTSDALLDALEGLTAVACWPAPVSVGLRT